MASKTRNPRGAGRKPNWYRSRQVSVPEPVLNEVKRAVANWKQDGKFHGELPKFYITEVAKEFANLVAECDLNLCGNKYPKLEKLYDKGNEANWREYMPTTSKQKDGNNE